MSVKTFAAGLLLLIANVAHTESLMHLEKAHLSFLPPPGYIVEKVIAERASVVEKGECFRIYTTGTKRFVGLFCSYSSMADVDEEHSIYPYSELAEPRGDVTSTGLVVGTPMMYYPMEEFITKLGDGAGAEVDCDLGDGPVYRATSTCHVGLVDLKNGEFLYGFLALRNHVSRTNFLSYKELANMWGGFIKD